VRDELGGCGEVAVQGRERELGDAGATRVAVVDEDRRLPGGRMLGHRHATDVPPVANGEQRQEPDQRVLGRVHGAQHLMRLHSRAHERGEWDRVPARARRERSRREIQRHYLDRLVG